MAICMMKSIRYSDIVQQYSEKETKTWAEKSLNWERITFWENGKRSRDKCCIEAQRQVHLVVKDLRCQEVRIFTFGEHWLGTRKRWVVIHFWELSGFLEQRLGPSTTGLKISPLHRTTASPREKRWPTEEGAMARRVILGFEHIWIHLLTLP